MTHISSFLDSAVWIIYRIIKWIIFIKWFIYINRFRFHNAFIAQSINQSSICTAEERAEVHPGKDTVFVKQWPFLVWASFNCLIVLQSYFHSLSRQMSSLSRSHTHIYSRTHGWGEDIHCWEPPWQCDRAAQASKCKLYQRHCVQVCEFYIPVCYPSGNRKSL